MEKLCPQAYTTDTDTPYTGCNMVDYTAVDQPYPGCSYTYTQVGDDKGCLRNGANISNFIQPTPPYNFISEERCIENCNIDQECNAYFYSPIQEGIRREPKCYIWKIQSFETSDPDSDDVRCYRKDI